MRAMTKSAVRLAREALTIGEQRRGYATLSHQSARGPLISQKL
jgi:hypothetical protein